MNIDELKKIIKKGQFNNPTKGPMNLTQVVEELVNYRKNDLVADYRIFIGTDSEEREKGVDLVSVIAIHRIGKGGRYFWLRSYDKKSLDLRTKIFIKKPPRP